MDANTTQTITKSGASAKKKEKFKDASNLSVVKAYVIGNGAVGSPKAFYLVTDSVSYLFNCGEMTQRMSTQLKLRLNKLDNIFITNSVWENIGGIPGMALTRQDANAEFLNIHGPGGLGEMFQLMKSFVCIKNLQINVMETARGGSFNDGIMDIKFVPIYPSEENTGVEESYFSENTDEDKADGDDETSVDYCDYSRESLDKDISLTISEEKYCCNVRDQSQKPSICYVCKTPDILGKLNLEACAKRNIPTGPLFGKLKKKENIILPNGESVNYKDVTFPDVPGKIFLVVDCPKRRYLDALLQEPILMEYQMAVDPAKIPVLIVHFSHPSVMNDPKYVQWMSSFPQVTKHLRLNEDNVDVGTPPTHKLQTKLNLVHEEIFPRLPNPAIPLVRSVQELKKDGDETTQNIPVNFECSFLEGRTLMCIDFKNFNISQDPSFALWPEEYVQEALSEEGASQTLENLKKELNQLQLDLDTKGDYPKFLFLGTGSSCPQSIRNTSGILVFTTENTCMLLDCGEGTYNQLIIFFGNKIAEEVLLKLKAVFISHMHADHHLGFLGILKGRRRAIDNHFKKVKCSPEFQNTPTTEMVSKLNIKPLYLVGPNAIKVYLKLYHSIFEEVLPDFRTIPSSAFKVLFYLHKKETSASSVKKKSPPSPAMLKNFLEDVRLKELKTTYVRHCSEAYGVSFVTENNFKVTYSGDCMPSGNLIELGRDSDILIHEATMDNDRKEDAVRKLHSTTDQALQVGKKMNAKFTMLTHFSQRYVYLPRCTESFLENVGVAFDMMTFTMKQIALIPKLMPALRLIFAEKIREMDQKYLKSESSKNIMGPSLKRKAADVPSDRLSRYQSFKLSSFPVKTRQTFNLIQVKRDFSRYNNEFTGEMAVEYPRMVMVVHKNSWNQIPI